MITTSEDNMSPLPSGNNVEKRRPKLHRRLINKFTTRDGLLGDYDYKYLFTPQIPFVKKKEQSTLFFGLNTPMPLLLGILLGFQHTLAMLAGVVTPPMIIASSANFDAELSQYLVSASLIVSGLLSAIQITRIHIPFTKYYLGTGLVSVVGTSFATLTIVSAAFPQFYRNGFCPSDSDGNPLPCPDGYGAILGTACVCGLLEVVLSFIPPKTLKKIFPPVVTGPVVFLIGVSLIQSGMNDWAGGAGCQAESGLFSMCPTTAAPKPLPWGSAEFIGLGFLVLVTILLSERFGAPIMKSCAVIIGLLVGCIVAAACGYFDRSSIDAAPAVTFIWVKTFKLSVYGPIVLPMLAVYFSLVMETTGDITATCDVSRIAVDGPEFESRVQGGILADGLNGILAGLFTITPMSVFAQNNGIIALTRCANRVAGYWACFFLVVMGIFSKFAASLVAIPKSVLGGMTTFLFASVAVSGFKVISLVPFTRRDRIVLTFTLVFGMGAVLVPTWFSHVFTYHGDNTSLRGLMDAVELVMETSYCIGGFVGIIVNQVLPQEMDETWDEHDAASNSEQEIEPVSIVPAKMEYEQSAPRC